VRSSLVGLAIAVVALGAAAPAHADDAADKQAAQALVTDGLAALKKKDYDTAIARFNEAYAKFPSPKILLNLGTTYKDMGRFADAANTYQKYLADPTVGTDRLTEVKKLLDDLDKSLLLLTVSVTPAGASVAIDDGNADVIGSSLTTRVMPGKHTIHATLDGYDAASQDLDATAGARQTVSLTLTKTVTVVDTHDNALKPPPVDLGDGGGGGDDGPVFTDEPKSPGSGIQLPALALQTRIDGKGRGAALAIAIDYSPIGPIEVELAALLSNAYGVYGGVRWRILPSKLAPTLGAGFPVFFSNGSRWGARISAGGQYRVSKNVMAIAELGFEHFFNPEQYFDANLFVPIVGIQGRLR
jgi:hypothetical protein